MTVNRRHALGLFAAVLVFPAAGGLAQAQTPAVSRTTAYAFSFPGLDGHEIRLVANAGKPILVVNTASLCGYTPQFTGLQELWTRYRGRGLLIVGVPANDFGGQEPGGPADIMKTAHDEYHVTFPLASKVTVKGPDAHPFYRWAALQRPSELPRWNFHKYLVGRDGMIRASFSTTMEPTDPKVVAAIEQELAPE